MENIKKICVICKLGSLEQEPKIVTGGLLHKMYCVETNQGKYAIKVLNSNVMNKPDALEKLEQAERIAYRLKNENDISAICVKSMDGKMIFEVNHAYYEIFEWFDGKSVFYPDITAAHCAKVGEQLGKIHASNICVEGLYPENTVRCKYEWKYLLSALKKDVEVYSLFQENVLQLEQWDCDVVENAAKLKSNQIISHRDLDPKNIMWKNDVPYIIDWEAAGYINPYEELIQVLNYWIVDENQNYNKEKFDALMNAYRSWIDVKYEYWNEIFLCGCDAMLGWLAYNIQVLIEAQNPIVENAAREQITKTLFELKMYDKQQMILKNWILQYL